MQTRRDVFQAIADPTRRDIINLIARQSMNLNSIAENFDVSRPAISQHIKILIECGLVSIKKQGRERFAEATLKPLNEVTNWVRSFQQRIDERFDALDAVLDEMKEQEKGKQKRKSKKRH